MTTTTGDDDDDDEKRKHETLQTYKEHRIARDDGTHEGEEAKWRSEGEAGGRGKNHPRLSLGFSV